jgi:hypothetical protein
MHAEFTPLTPFPGTRYFEQQQENVLTKDWQVYDMLHFVTRTPTPTKKLYRRILSCYRQTGYGVIRREKLYLPHRALRPHHLKLAAGLLANAWSIRCAHHHVPPPLANRGREEVEQSSREAATQQGGRRDAAGEKRGSVQLSGQ